MWLCKLKNPTSHHLRKSVPGLKDRVSTTFNLNKSHEIHKPTMCAYRYFDQQ